MTDDKKWQYYKGKVKKGNKTMNFVYASKSKNPLQVISRAKGKNNQIIELNKVTKKSVYGKLKPKGRTRYSKSRKSAIAYVY